jgi:hypothetical protein
LLEAGGRNVVRLLAVAAVSPVTTLLLLIVPIHLALVAKAEVPGDAWPWIVWGIAFVLQRALNVYFRGLDCEVRLRELSAGGGTLRHERALELCATMLRHARRYTYFLLDPKRRVSLRATISVPIRDGIGEVRWLRTWCYDNSRGVRRFSRHSIGQTGAPKAYTEGKVQVIKDVWEEHWEPVEPRREYRSIVCIPVRKSEHPGQDYGSILAVLSIDASEPRFFNPKTALPLVPVMVPIVRILGALCQSVGGEGEYKFKS